MPDDVSVVGFDDRNFASMWSPALTSYGQNYLEMGRRAFRMLYEQVKAKRDGVEPPDPRVEVVEGQPALRASESVYVPWR